MAKEELSNELLGRYFDEVRISNKETNKSISELNTSVIVIRERTKILPELREAVTENEKKILVMQTQDETRNETVEKGRKNLKLAFYVIGSLITIGSAYGAIVISLAN